jgi:hypothetical protein
MIQKRSMTNIYLIGRQDEGIRGMTPWEMGGLPPKKMRIPLTVILYKLGFVISN